MPAIRTGGSGGMVTARIVNLNEFLRGIDSYYKECIEDVEEQLEKSLRRHVYEPSQRLVPVDTGLLKSSGFVAVQQTRAGKLEGGVGYDTEYAIFVHENPTAYHKPPTQWKYVEQPMAENLDRICDELIRSITEAW